MEKGACRRAEGDKCHHLWPYLAWYIRRWALSRTSVEVQSSFLKKKRNSEGIGEERKMYEKKGEKNLEPRN